VNITGYDINFTLDLSSDKIDIDAQVAFRKKDSVSSLSLLLTHNASLNSVISTTKEIIPFHISGDDILTISLPGKLKYSKDFTLLFSYVLPADSFLVGKGMFVLKRVFRWYPLQLGDLFSSTLRITVSDNLTTLSNGSCRKKYPSRSMCTFIWRTNHESDLAVFIFNPDSMDYKQVFEMGTKLNFYFIRGFQDEQKIISNVKSSFGFYSKFLGKYQNDTYTVIEIPADWVLGQSLHTFLLFTPKLLEYVPDPGIWVPHEVGHQWFGNNVIADQQAPGRWFVEESINEYLRAMYIEHLYGQDSLKHMMQDFYIANYKTNVKEGKDVSIMDVTSVTASLEEAQTIYAKGPVVLHLLRKCMDDVNWNTMIKKIYNNYQHSLFTLEDFKRSISQQDHSGKCLNFFNTFLITKGIPEKITN
jgi:hypothetical protein